MVYYNIGYLQLLKESLETPKGRLVYCIVIDKKLKQSPEPLLVFFSNLKIYQVGTLTEI